MERLGFCAKKAAKCGQEIAPDPTNASPIKDVTRVAYRLTLPNE